MVKVLVFFIRLYQRFISPLLGNVCRFTPSCSQYAVEALQVHGVFKGLALAAWRILRCQPFCKCGHDPVPPRGQWPARIE
jgi:putative membrane protein insertion efficiency factor